MIAYGIESEILFHKGRSPNTEILLPAEQVMVKITEMDDTVTLGKQFETEVGPVILMNKFNVSPDEVEEFLKVFAETTKAFKAATWIHFRSVAPRNCWEFYIH